MFKCCEAILQFPEGKFVMCEKEKDHEGNHKGLVWEWLGEGTSEASAEVKRFGDELVKLSIFNAALRSEFGGGDD